MNHTQSAVATHFAMPAGRSRLQRLGRVARKNPLGVFGFSLVAFVVVLAAFGPLVAPDHASISPNLRQGPSAEHWFGTDTLGRDYFARVIAGARLSISLAMSAMLIGSLLALSFGMLSAYAGGLVDLIFQRFIDIILAFPGLILLLLLGQVLGRGWHSIAIGLGLLTSVGLSRIIRASTLKTLNETYIDAARALGASSRRIILRHLLPNMGPPMLIYVTALIGGAILAEGALAFLGLGVEPPAPSWGRMLNEARGQWRLPHLSIFPGLMMTMAVLGFNLLGDSLRDVFDPRLRGS
jgi:peptide/nickel transport system permease protein